MTLNDRHIKNTSFTPSPAHTALKKAAKVVGIAIATIVGIILWAIFKPIFRGGVSNIYPHRNRNNLLDINPIKRYDYGKEKTFKDLDTTSQILRGQKHR